MTEKSFVFDNKRERKIYELYLNPKFSDVNFVFDASTDHSEKIPAHKLILSLDSVVFDTMFFGSITEQVDVPIVDAPAAAFKEFLQFFYLNEVHLSSTNIVHVTNLCKKYEMIEFLKPCEIALRTSLTMDDMCWGYTVSLLLEQANLRKFCEEQIRIHAQIIMHSESFLECDSNSLSKILTLVSCDWSALELVIACMEWSKAQCKRHNLDVSSKNLRDQLEDVFNQIPFDKLTTQQISQHVALYKGFFTGEEFEAFFHASLPKQPNPFELQPLQDDLRNIPSSKLLECNRRRYTNTTNPLCSRRNSATTFSANTTLLLIKFSVYNIGSKFDYVICECDDDEPTSLNYETIANGKSETCDIFLPKQVVINIGKFYRIYVSCAETNGKQNQINSLQNEVRLEHGIVIKFSPKFEDKITNLSFVTPGKIVYKIVL